MKNLFAFILFVSMSANAFAWESASTYDPKRGRYVSTDEYKKDHDIPEREQVCQSASCWGKNGHLQSADEYNKDLAREPAQIPQPDENVATDQASPPSQASQSDQAFSN